MQIPLQITFRNIAPSAAIEERVREHAAQLERFCDRIGRCRVVIESPHRSHHRGNLFYVAIDVTVPGAELVVNREPSQHHAYEDVYVAIRDAFNAAVRQLEDYNRRRHGQVKQHEEPLTSGRIVRLFPKEGYGFIATPDGREIYFHRNSLIEAGFESLTVGSDVHFAWADNESDKGPQATTVKLERSV